MPKSISLGATDPFLLGLPYVSQKIIDNSTVGFRGCSHFTEIYKNILCTCEMMLYYSCYIASASFENFIVNLPFDINHLSYLDFIIKEHEISHNLISAKYLDKINNDIINSSNNIFCKSYSSSSFGLYPQHAQQCVMEACNQAFNKFDKNSADNQCKNNQGLIQDVKNRMNFEYFNFGFTSDWMRLNDILDGLDKVLSEYIAREVLSNPIYSYIPLEYRGMLGESIIRDLIFGVSFPWREVTLKVRG